ncbi:MAG: glycosyltransferase [Prevotella sp.]|nr:glycosyltransferase [Prevotella sp.]
MNYEVTIGIPVYNTEKYLRQTMESALAQSFENIEFLILDDCGTDSSMSIILEFQQSHPRGKDIHILHQPHNMGVSAARNRIIDEAQGNFLYFMDADDLIEPETLSFLMSHQRKTGADIVYGSYEKIETYNNNKVVATIQYPLMELKGKGCLAQYAWSKFGNVQTTIWNFVVEVQLLREAKIRFIETNFWEDMAFAYDLFPICNHAVLLPDITYHYMCRLNSLSRYQQREQISKDEVLQNISTINYMKKQCVHTKMEFYHPQHCLNVLIMAFYVFCYILKNKKMISPSFTNIELRSILIHPMIISDIMHFKHDRIVHLLFYLVGKFPPKLFVWTISLVGKIKGLI